MKGTIARCLGELVCEKFGKDKWENALERAGLSRNTEFNLLQDVDDGAVMRVIDAVCKELNITNAQAVEAFGDYWVNIYASKLYKIYFDRAKSAKEFLLKMDGVHDTLTKTMSNARPPRFKYEQPDDKTLIMQYSSHRGLIEFLPSLVKGVGKFYKENMTVSKIAPDKIKIVFEK
jgi:hypothetical protein